MGEPNSLDQNLDLKLVLCLAATVSEMLLGTPYTLYEQKANKQKMKRMHMNMEISLAVMMNICWQYVFSNHFSIKIVQKINYRGDFEGQHGQNIKK